MTFAHLKPSVATLSRITDRSAQRPREAVRARLRALLSAPAGQHRSAAGRPQHPPRRPADAMADALRPLAGASGCSATTGRRRGRHGPGGRHDEWQVSDRRYLSEGSMALLNLTPTDTNQVAPPALLTA